MDNKELENLPDDIRALGLETFQERILSELEPALAIRLQRADDLPPGQSKLGGKPDLPPQFEYPLDKHGHPLTFLAQYRLADLASFPVASVLPPEGMLYFFHQVDENGNLGELGVVRYWDGEPSLLQPSQLTGTRAYRQAAIQFDEIAATVDFDFTWRLNPEERDAFVYELTTPVEDAWFDEKTTVEDAWCSLVYECLTHSPHQLLGYPAPIIGGSSVIGWLADESSTITSVDTLLLQLDQEKDLGIEWYSDIARVYFFIATEELRKGNFTRCQYTFQRDN